MKTDDIEKALEIELTSIKDTVAHHERQRNYTAANNWYHYQTGIEKAIWVVTHLSKYTKAKKSK